MQIFYVPTITTRSNWSRKIIYFKAWNKKKLSVMSLFYASPKSSLLLSSWFWLLHSHLRNSPSTDRLMMHFESNWISYIGCEWPLRVWTTQPLIMSEMLITRSNPHVTAFEQSTCRADIEPWCTLKDLIIASDSMAKTDKCPIPSPVITSNSPYWTAVTCPCVNWRRL